MTLRPTPKRFSLWEQDGDINGSYMAGECAGMVKRVEPAKAIVEDLILGAEAVIERFVAPKVK